MLNGETIWPRRRGGAAARDGLAMASPPPPPACSIGDCDPAQIVHFFANYFWAGSTSPSAAVLLACGVPSWRETKADRGIIGAPWSAPGEVRQLGHLWRGHRVESTIEDWGGKSFVMRVTSRGAATPCCARAGKARVRGPGPEDPLRIKAPDPQGPGRQLSARTRTTEETPDDDYSSPCGDMKFILAELAGPRRHRPPAWLRRRPAPT